METKLREIIKKELNEMKAPESLYDFANQVPDIVEKMPTQLPIRSKKRYRKTLYTSITGVACAAMLMISINTSPTFAKYIEQIPVLSEVGDYLKFDRGIQKAENNGVVQDVSMFVEDNGITFTIDKVISDAKRTLVYYELELDKSLPSSLDLVDFNQYKIVDDENETLSEIQRKPVTNEVIFGEVDTNRNFLPRSITGGNPMEGDANKYAGIMEFVNQDATPSIPKALQVSIDSFLLVDYDAENEIVQGNWNVTIPLDTKYVDAKPIEYEGEEFSIKAGEYNLDLVVNSVSVYPTITDMSMDLKNELDVPIFYEYHLENEDGKVYIHLEDRIMTDSGDVLPQFESNYFDDSEKLYLVIDKVNIGTADMKLTSYDVQEKIELKKK